MDNQPHTSTINQPTHFLNGKQLAEVLDVSAPTLSEAVKNGYNCSGHPVCEWAEQTGSGRIKGYHVPVFLIGDKPTQKTQKRANSDAKSAYNGKISPNEPNNTLNQGGDVPAGLQEFIDQYVEGQQASVNVQKSWLPPNQNYAEPVGMASLASVLKKALETNTPESRMLIFGAMTGFGSLIGHTVNDNGWGAAVGGLSTVGLMYVAYQWLSRPQTYPNQPNLGLKVYKRMQVNEDLRINQSGYSN